MKKIDIIRELCLRKLKFHHNEEWQIKGLFSWKDALPFLVSNVNAKEKLLITDYKEENKTIWAIPTKEFLEGEILPLLKKISYKDLNGQIAYLEGLRKNKQLFL